MREAGCKKHTFFDDSGTILGSQNDQKSMQKNARKNDAKKDQKKTPGADDLRRIEINPDHPLPQTPSPFKPDGTKCNGNARKARFP